VLRFCRSAQICSLFLHWTLLFSANMCLFLQIWANMHCGSELCFFFRSVLILAVLCRSALICSLCMQISLIFAVFSCRYLRIYADICFFGQICPLLVVKRLTWCRVWATLVVQIRKWTFNLDHAEDFFTTSSPYTRQLLGVLGK
jgi:hypothetical protein